MNATLVIMAAGIGSRYGGEKQTDGIGPNGEAIMEYSVYDAVQAGFHKFIFILKPGMEETLNRLCGDRLRRQTTPEGQPVEVCCVTQDYTSLPAFYKVPPTRTKPFGTVHAVLCARGAIDEPFAIVNADDYYGVEAYQTMIAQLMALPPQGEGTMVGYRLKNTVSEHGAVTRGLCKLEGDLLQGVREMRNVKLLPDGSIAETALPEGDRMLDPDSVVSMNFWGFTPWIFEKMEEYFHDFLKNLAPEEEKAECLLPIMTDHLIQRGELKVTALHTDSVWFGVTYQGDRVIVAEELRKLHEAGVYPPSLKE